MTPLLEIENLTKTFPGTVALQDVNFDLHAGEVHALIGENGAGKSTMIKIVAGIYQPDSGQISIYENPVELQSPVDSLEQGIKVVYQELDLAPNLSVAENVFMGGYPRTRFGTVDWRTLHDRTAQLLSELGLDIDPRLQIDELRVAEQQLVEIARAISRQAQIIIMDEPTSALSPSEIEKLFDVIENMQGRGVGVVYVSHKLDEIYRIADRVTVLRDGHHIVTANVSDTTSQDLVRWMVGREITDLYPKTEAQIGEVVLQVNDLRTDKVGPINFALRAGEVLSIFGLMGAGVHLVGRMVFGDEFASGSVTVDGVQLQANSPTDAIKKGVGLLTENRKEDGLLLPLGVKENMTLAALSKFANLTLIQGRSEVNAATEYVDRLSIKTPSLRQKIRYLSGGNQQKALIGRWMLQDLKVLILSEPTRGIDVGSKSEIYRLIDELANQGMAILVLSTELQEVLGIADRILVIREGKLTGEFARGEADQEKLMTAAVVIQEDDEANLAPVMQEGMD